MPSQTPELVVLNPDYDYIKFHFVIQEASDGAQKDTPIWDKTDGGVGQTRSKDRLLAPEFVKKYLEIAKCMKPALTEEACEMIGEEYAKLRSQDFENQDVARTQPVTARALETLIRLSTAHAKARLSKVNYLYFSLWGMDYNEHNGRSFVTLNTTTMSPITFFQTVDAVDAETAIELVQFAYFKKVLAKDKKKRRHDSDEEDDEEEIPDQEKPEDESAPEPKRPKKDASPVPQGPVEINVVRLEQFKIALFGIFESTRQQNLHMDDVRKHIVTENNFSEGEMMAAIDKMSDDNKVMLSADVLYLI